MRFLSAGSPLLAAESVADVARVLVARRKLERGGQVTARFAGLPLAETDDGQAGHGRRRIRVLLQRAAKVGGGGLQVVLVPTTTAKTMIFWALDIRFNQASAVFGF